MQEVTNMINKIIAAFLTAIIITVCLLSTAESAAGAPDFSQRSDGGVLLVAGRK